LDLFKENLFSYIADIAVKTHVSCPGSGGKIQLAGQKARRVAIKMSTSSRSGTKSADTLKTASDYKSFRTVSSPIGRRLNPEDQCLCSQLETIVLAGLETVIFGTNPSGTGESPYGETKSQTTETIGVFQ
jgi:hypothetical protein